VKNPGQIGLGVESYTSQEIEDTSDGETGDDFQLIFIAVFQFIESGPNTHSIEDYVFPRVLFGQRPNLLTD
jgi:hypothetical protein